MPSVRDVYDQNGNELFLDRRDENGAKIEARRYDAYGRLASRSRPYPTTAIGTESSLPHATYTYDILGRFLSQTLSPSVKTCSYDGNRTRCQTRTTVNWQDDGVDINNTFAQDESLLDQTGRLLERQEWVGAQEDPQVAAHPVVTRYAYGPFGVLRDVVPMVGSTLGWTHNEYDIRGRRLTINDPDSGLETDTFDAFDRVRKIESSATSTALDYDDVDRKISELTSKGGPTPSTFVFDQSANGIGQISSHTSSDGVGVTFDYDTHGRPAGETWSVPGAGGDRQLDLGYDPFGRPRTITYPLIDGARYGVVFGYTTLSGELQTVTTADGAQTLWQADSRNPERNLLHETFGDGAMTARVYEPERGYLTSITSGNGSQVFQNLGFSYDAAGFMSTRDNFIDGDGESFTHDELGRLTHWSGGSGAGRSTTSMTTSETSASVRRLDRAPTSR